MMPFCPVGSDQLPAYLRRIDRRSAQSSGTVLVVEDAPDTLAVLTLMLEVSGYKVIGARDGLDALRKFDEVQPDLVILDLDLPVVSGFRLIHLFRQERTTRPVPVVVVTGYDYDEAEDVARAGAADLITKPFDAQDLLGRVEFALRRARSGKPLSTALAAATV